LQIVQFKLAPEKKKGAAEAAPATIFYRLEGWT